MRYHILNGDALLDKFPKIEGELIILRECLVEGNKRGKTWEQFISNRQAFIVENYGESKEDYGLKCVAEFEKIKQISAEDDVYFWFEDDLFCQVNFWFACSLLSVKHNLFSCFFVRAKPTHEHGYGGMSKEELLSSFQKSISIYPTDIQLFINMWNAFRTDEVQYLIELKSKLSDSFKFVKNAIDSAEKLLSLDNRELNFYERQILEIITHNRNISFGEVFQKFNRQNSILGFGDLQVKRMYEKVLPNV